MVHNVQPRRVDPLRSRWWVWWALRIGVSAQRWKRVHNRRLFSFCLPESRRPSRTGCRGHPDTREHSDVIQKWNWDVSKVDQPSLPPVEGLCMSC